MFRVVVFIKNFKKMISLLIIIVFIGSYIAYNTSKQNIQHSKSIIEVWIKAYLRQAKITSIVLLLLALVLAVLKFGYGSGVLLWLFLLILFVGLITIIFPLKIVKYSHVIIAFLILITFEIIF